jgi:DeoR/GlpR family transcriptional regulator of sugar metabolism
VEAVAERRQLVLNAVMAGHGNVRVLCERLGVSEATIRRDLDFLTRAGMATRTYGGAVSGPGRLELSLQEKESLNPARKLAIARRALSHVKDGDAAILDAGTTVGRLATLLDSRQDLTIVTNGISTLLALAGAEGVELILLGGRLRHISQAFLGPLAEGTLERLTADVAFLGANGVGRFGVCCPTDKHASLKSLMAKRASRVFVLADGSKLGQAPHQHWMPVQQEWCLITDSSAPTSALEEIRQQGVAIEVVEAAE